MDVIVYLAGAESGRFGQITGFLSTYYPECNGNESNISACSQTVRDGACNLPVLYVRCYHDAMCGIANPTSGSPTMTEQSTATSPESPFHSTTTTVDPTGATKPTSEPVVTDLSGQGSSEQRQSDQTLIITIAVSVGATFVLTLLISTVMFIVISLYCKYCGILDKCTESQEHVHKAEPNIKEQGLWLIDNPSTEQHQAIPIYDTIMDYEELNTTVSEVSGSRECRDEGEADTVENIVTVHVAHLQSSNNPQTIKNITTLTNEAYYGVSNTNEGEDSSSNPKMLKNTTTLDNEAYGAFASYNANGEELKD